MYGGAPDAQYGAGMMGMPQAGGMEMANGMAPYGQDAYAPEYQMGGPQPKYMTTAVYSGESDKEGVLLLQNTTKKSLWQPRYVVLKENYLFLFKRQPMLLMRSAYPKPGGYFWNLIRKIRQERTCKILALEHATIEVAETATMKPNTFCVYHRNESRMGKWFFAYFLACENPNDMQDWMKALKSAKTSHIEDRMKRVGAVHSSGLHEVSKKLYNAEKQKLEVVEDLVEMENKLFKAIKEEIRVLERELDDIKQFKALPPPAPAAPPPPSKPPVIVRVPPPPPPVPETDDEPDAKEGLDLSSFERQATSGPPPIPASLLTPKRPTGTLDHVSKEIIVYEDEIDDDNIVGEVLVNGFETVEELRGQIEKELELDEGFIMVMNDEPLLHHTFDKQLMEFLKPENNLIIQY